MPAKTSEVTLMKRIADGEESAFAQLYSSTAAIIYGYLMRIASDRDAADTLLILTFQHVWQHANEFDPQFVPLHWILKIARKLGLESGALKKTEDGDSEVEQIKIAALDRQKTFIQFIRISLFMMIW